ncbi:MAG: mannose-6-phosphate isomerase, class I [Archangium sp.]|nr:mannose-6-phosphate isomerase, class I [Archangium sp.]
MIRLENQIQPYAWGSRSAIPALLGVPENGKPQAELWLGAHPVAPSRVPGGRALGEWLAEDAGARLGAKTVERFGAQLPFLLKVLAAAEPLSLQAHPSLEQAKAGFAREEEAGVPLTAPHRNYRDANHKPEIICALTKFEALCGFRSIAETVRVLDAFGVDPQLLRERGLRAFFERVMTDKSLRLTTPAAGTFDKEAALVKKLSAKYPGDVGVLGALLLNHLTLEPGEALYLGAGNLHAYLEGTGVELMANSDNVLRGGLTPKHVDVAELLSVLEFTDGPPRVLKPNARGEYETPAPDFRLSRIELRGEHTFESGLPQILLCVEGGATELPKGASVFVPATERVTLKGEATIFRATPGL